MTAARMIVCLGDLESLAQERYTGRVTVLVDEGILTVHFASGHPKRATLTAEAPVTLDNGAPMRAHSPADFAPH